MKEIKTYRGAYKPEEDKFYFCLFELDNGKKVSVFTYKSFDEIDSLYKWNNFLSLDKDGNEIDVGEYTINYADDYVFGENFFDWFERLPPGKDVKNYPNKYEARCVIDYYENNIKII